MRWKETIVFLCLTFLCVNGEAQGKRPFSSQAPLHLDLPEALGLCLKQSPEIRKINVELADKLAGATQVQLPQNPELKLEVKSYDSIMAEDKTFKLEVEQPFRLSHLGLRQIYAAALKDVARTEQQAEVVYLLNEATLFYYRLWMLQKQERALARFKAQDEQVLEFLSRKASEVPALDQALLQAQVMELMTELDLVRAQRKQAQRELLRAMGLPWQEIRLASPRLKSIPEDLFKLQSFAQGRANLRELVLQKERAAQRRYDVARVDLFPELIPFMTREWSEHRGQAEWGIGLAVRVPLWDWNQAELARAKARQEEAQAESSSLDRATFDKLIEIRQTRALVLEKRADIYWKKILPAYRNGFQLAYEQLEQGQVSAFQFWELQQKSLDIHQKGLQAMAQMLEARTALEQALGGRLEEMSE